MGRSALVVGRFGSGSFRPQVISAQFQYGRVYKHGLIFCFFFECVGGGGGGGAGGG